MDNKELEGLKALAEKAEKGGQHIYTHLRDSNKHVDNNLWHCAASPEAFLSLISRIEQAEEWIATHQRQGLVQAMESAAHPTPAVDISGLTREIEQLLSDAENENAYGGSEDSDGALNPGYVNWAELKQKVRSILSAPVKAQKIIELKRSDGSPSGVCIAAPVVREGKMTDERIAEIMRTQFADFSCTPDDIAFARAIEREVLATGKEAETQQFRFMQLMLESIEDILGEHYDKEIGHARSLQTVMAAWQAEAQLCEKYKTLYKTSIATPSTPSQAWNGELPPLPFHDPERAERENAFMTVKMAQDYARKAIGAAVAGVRDKALEEAARECSFRSRNWLTYVDEALMMERGEAAGICADAILRLKTNPASQEAAEAEIPAWIQFDGDDTLTIYGIKYSAGLFRELGGISGALRLGDPFRVVSRENGVLTIQRAEQPIPAQHAGALVPQGWISVDERLPELGQTVLGFSPEYGQRETVFDRWPQGSINRMKYGDEAGYFQWDEPQSHWTSSWKPTHWQPRATAPAPSVTREKGEQQ